MNEKIAFAFMDELEKISACPPKVSEKFAKEKIFKVKKREVPIKGIRAVGVSK